MKPTRAVVLCGALLVAACGGDDSAATSAAPASASGATSNASQTAEPVTVDHRYGSTTIDSTPERIVSLDTQWTDVLVALDAPLVGAALDPVADGGRYPWQGDIPEDVESIPVTDSIPYEAVAALRPDLIVITWAATDQATYDQLSAIAPTIPLLGDEEVDAWQDIATVAGDVLDLDDEAADLITDSEQLSADVLAELPGLEGRTYALANYVPGDSIYVVADADDGAGIFFGQLGLDIDPDLLAIADGASGRVQLSLERIDELDADLLIMLTNGADAGEIPGYASLPAVQDGAVALLDVADVTGLNTPTPLSIPYSLERIRSALEAAAS
jgi:iron complex transport system substrate-binding protein